MTIRNGSKPPQDFIPRPDNPLRGMRHGRRKPSMPHTPPKDPNKWRPEYAEQCRHMMMLGATDVEMAAALGVSLDAFKAFKKDKYGLQLALRRGKLEADAKVVASVFKRATGFTVRSEKVFLASRKSIEKDGDQVTTIVEPEVVRVETAEYYPPDVGAGRYWLNNRRSAQWSDRQEISGPGGAPLVGGDVTVNNFLQITDQNEASKLYLRLMNGGQVLLPPPAPVPLPEPGTDTDHLPAPELPEPSPVPLPDDGTEMDGD